MAYNLITVRFIYIYINCLCISQYLTTCQYLDIHENISSSLKLICLFPVMSSIFFSDNPSSGGGGFRHYSTILYILCRTVLSITHGIILSQNMLNSLKTPEQTMTSAHKAQQFQLNRWCEANPSHPTGSCKYPQFTVIS